MLNCPSRLLIYCGLGNFHKTCKARVKEINKEKSENNIRQITVILKFRKNKKQINPTKTIDSKIKLEIESKDDIKLSISVVIFFISSAVFVLK